MIYNTPQFVLDEAIKNFNWDDETLKNVQFSRFPSLSKLNLNIDKFSFEILFYHDEEFVFKETFFTGKPKISLSIYYQDMTKNRVQLFDSWLYKRKDLKEFNIKVINFIQEYLKFEKKSHIENHKKILNAYSIIINPGNLLKEFLKENDIEFVVFYNNYRDQFIRIYLLDEEETALVVLKMNG